jgi:hypothetical protein
MLALMLGALRSRTAHTATVLVLAVLAVAAAAAAPWYVLAADDAALLGAVNGASAGQRVFDANRGLTISSDARTALDQLDQTVRGTVDLPVEASYLGMYQLGLYQSAGLNVSVPIAYRDAVCAHLTVTGDCPSRPGEAIMSRRSAALLHATVGDSLGVEPGVSSVQLRIVGLYDWADPAGAYWANPLFGPPATEDSAGRADPMFVTSDTFVPRGFDHPTGTDDLVLPVAAFRDPGLGARLEEIRYELTQHDLQTYQGADTILRQIALEQGLINVGVVAGAAQLLVLCWFALYLAGRSSGPQRRLDVGLLKLRGASFGRLLRLTIGHSAAPILAGLVPGVALGYLAARWLAGPLADPSRNRLAWQLSAGAVLLAVLGGVLAIVVAEWRTLRAPVVDLLRRVPPRQLGWRADVVSLCVVALAVAGAYQVLAQGGVNGSVPGLALLAPGLVALALAVVLARGLTAVAGSVGGAALRAGRLRLALGALQVARRPGVDRVFLLLAVSVAVLASAASSWYTASAARTSRAEQEVGADRVLTVRALDRTQLLDAVRAADPTGREAMAVVYNGARVDGSPPVLAVDSTRLAAVASWQPGYGTDPATLAAQLRAPAPEPLTVTAGTVTLDATVLPAPGDTAVEVELARAGTGETMLLEFGPLASGRHSYQAAVPSCVDGGCRLVSLRLVGPAVPSGARPDAVQGTSVTIDGIGQRGPGVGTGAEAVVAGPDVLGDIRRWRGAFEASSGNPTLRADAGGLTVTLPGANRGGGAAPAAPPRDGRVFVVDTPLPMPAVLVGAAPSDWGTDRPQLAPFGVASVPIQVSGGATALPVVGQSGVLVDLATATRAAGEDTIGDQQQVWLARSAPADLPDRLRAAGLTILGADSVGADLSRSSVSGAAAALRFQLLTAIAGLLLGAAALTVVAAAERGPRAAELAALRRQGLAGPAARAVGYGGYATLVAVAVLAGLAGTVLARLAGGPGLPPFSQPWTVLPVPDGLRALPVLLVGAAALALLGAVAATAGAQVTRAMRGGGTGS